MKWVCLIFLLLFVLSYSQTSAQWSTVGSFPGGGPVDYVLVVDDTIYAAIGRLYWSTTNYASNSGLYRSTDAGATWESLGLNEKTITCLAKIGSSLIVGTRYSGGIYTSSNEGSTWENPVPDQSEIIFSLAAVDTFVYAGGNANHIWVSTNRGFSWRDLGPTSYFDVWAAHSFAFAGPYAFAVQELSPRLIRSAIGTSSWSHISSPADSTSHEPYPNYIFSRGSTILIPTVEGLFASYDYGNWWERIGSGLPQGVKAHDFCTVGDSILALAGSDIYFSQDTGVSWRLLSHFPHGTNPTTMGAGKKILAIGTRESGVYISTDKGSTWGSPGVADPAVVTSLATRDNNVFVGTSVGLYRSTNKGSSWSITNLGCVNCMTRVVNNGTNIIAGTEGAGVFLSTDEGATWINAWTGGSGIICNLVSAGNATIASEYYPPPPGCWGRGCTHGYSSFLSTDNGMTWNDPFYNMWTTSLTALDEDLFAGVYDYGVYRSSNHGLDWMSINSGLIDSSVYAMTTFGGNIIAGTNNGVSIFSNGTTWSEASTGLPQSSRVTTLATFGLYLFAGTNRSGIFWSTNSGTTWSAINSSLTDLNITTLAVSDSFLFAGTNTGVWRRPLSEIVSSAGAVMTDLPLKSMLAQNYPNPFNPSTTIRYDLPNRSHATLTVFNTLGQQVALLVNGEMEAGYHEVLFDGSKLASGVYLYKMQAGSYVETKKLLLVR